MVQFEVEIREHENQFPLTTSTATFLVIADNE